MLHEAHPQSNSCVFSLRILRESAAFAWRELSALRLMLWTNHSLTENKGTITLTAGQKYDTRMEYYDNSGGATAKLSWSSSSQAKEVIPQSQLSAPLP